MNPTAAQFRERLDGALIPAVPVPFNDEGVMSLEAEQSLIAYHAASQAAGVAVWAHTGRGLRLTHVERREIFKRWRAGLRKDQFMIAGVGCPLPPDGSYDSISDGEYIARAASMAQDAVKFGADAILVYAPSKFRGRPDQDELILDYHESIMSVGAPMILFYLYEAAGGVNYSLKLLDSLLRMDFVAGIKLATLDSVMTFQDVSNLIRSAAPKAALLTGEDRFLGYTVMRGAVGALIGMGAVAPDLQVELLRFWRERQWERFIARSLALDRFAETTFIQPMEGYIRRVMLALALEGVIHSEHTFDPWGPPVKRAEASAIADALNVLKKS